MEPTEFYRNHASGYPQMSVGSRHAPWSPDLDRYETQKVIFWKAPPARTVEVCYGERTFFVKSTRQCRAVVMMKTGMKQADVARQLSVSVTSIEIWLSRYPTSESLRSQASRGRKPVPSRVAKIVLAEVVLKRRQSVRKLARKLTAKGHPTSKTVVDHYLTSACL